MHFPLTLIRLLLPALVVAWDAGPVWAQLRVTTLSDLQQTLAPGDSISLMRTSGEVVTGRLLRFGLSDLDVRPAIRPAAGQPVSRLDLTVPFETIQSLERLRDSTRNGMLIGAGIGAGFVGAMFAYAVAVDRNEIDEWGPIYLGYGVLFTGVGGLIGWAIDARHAKPYARFDRPVVETTKISLVPLGSRGRGMALVVAF